MSAQRPGRVALVVALVLLAHGLVLQTWRPASPPSPAQGAGVVQLRSLLLAPALPPADSATAPKPPLAATPPRDSAPTPATAEAMPVGPTPDRAPTPLPPPSPEPAAPPAQPALVTGAESSPLQAGRSIQPSPPGRWRYQFQMGQAQGEARLSWQHDGQQYRARLERELPGRQLPVWVSQGHFEDQGLAPDRFAAQRQDRDRQATNFRRDRGQISFSAVRSQLPLPDGAQDRLSWMLQLGAQLAAQPQLQATGRLIQMPVVGLRGEPLIWSFVVREIETLTMPQGPPVSALRLEREGLGPYEDRLEVWMDPARHFLPLKLRQWRAAPSSPEAQEGPVGWEMLLIGEESAPSAAPL